MIGPVLPELGDKICELLLSSLDEDSTILKACKAALSILEHQIVKTINEKLDPSKGISTQDDLIFNTTVDKILYSVGIFYNNSYIRFTTNLKLL